MPAAPTSSSQAFSQNHEGDVTPATDRLIPESGPSGAAVKMGMRTVEMIPCKYANPADLALLLGGNVAEGAGMPFAQHQVGGRQRAGKGARTSTEVFGSGDSGGGDTYWAQNLGGGLGRGTGGGNTGGNQGGNRGGGNTRGGNQGGGAGNNRGGGQGGRGGAGSQGMRPDGVDSIVAFMPQNALLVSGDPAAIDQLREILSILDQPTKQVEISTKFIEVDVTDENSFGIDWYTSNGSLEFFQMGFMPAGAINNVLRWAKGKFEASLGVTLSQNKGEVVNEPHITTQNNVAAYISFMTEIPYFTYEVTYNSFGQREVTPTDDSFEIEQTLDVTPTINADDTITMYLNPIMQDQTGSVVGNDGTSVPIIATQELGTQVTVADGETVVLGGMIRKQKGTNLRSTPLLSEIPIIGKLFQSKQISNVNQELLVFVTPRIVRDIPAP